MEAVISRMKTVKTAESRAKKKTFGANMRFLAISATIPNTEDVSVPQHYPPATVCMVYLYPLYSTN